MLNEHLPRSILEASLRKYLDPINFILLQIDPERDKSLIEDKKTLGTLHHSLNIARYAQKEFRARLLLNAPQDQLRRYLNELNLSIKLPNNPISYLKLIQKISSFDWGNNHSTEVFLESFGYERNLIPLEEKPFLPSETIRPASQRYRQLKDYQSQVFFDALKFSEIPNQKLLIQMPTGAGKTRVAVELLSQSLNKENNVQVVWLADRIELCEQAVETFLSVWPHISEHELTLYRIWKDVDPPKVIEGSALIVTMYQKIRSILNRKKNTSIKPDLIVADEAHNVLAPTYDKVIDDLISFSEKETRLIGLTATPGRSYGESLQNERLVDFFMKKIIEVDSGDIGVIEYLQGKRVLAHAIRKPLNTKIEYTLTNKEWEEFAKDFSDYPKGFLRRIAEDQKRNILIAFRLLELAQQDKQVLFFAASVEQSKMLCGLMISKGYLAAHIDATTPTQYRKDTVRKFKEGKIKLIFNYEIFAAGFDAPGIDAIFIARPTTSIVLYSQMIGRGMRGPELGGTDEFILIDVVDKIITGVKGLDDVFSYFADYWDEADSR